MNKHIFSGKLYGKSVVLERIHKKTAQKLWGKEPLVFCPSKMFPLGVWDTGHLVEPDHLKELAEQGTDPDNITFHRVLTNFECYNCNNETGKTASFYKVTYKEI